MIELGKEEPEDYHDLSNQFLEDDPHDNDIDFELTEEYIDTEPTIEEIKEKKKAEAEVQKLLLKSEHRESLYVSIRDSKLLEPSDAITLSEQLHDFITDLGYGHDLENFYPYKTKVLVLLMSYTFSNLPTLLSYPLDPILWSICGDQGPWPHLNNDPIKVWKFLINFRLKEGF